MLIETEYTIQQLNIYSIIVFVSVILCLSIPR